jgi:hypothetical protein
MNGRAEPDRLLAIYLNDHLAGATLGVELARRLRAQNEDDAELGEPLAEICDEIEADRLTLERAMERLGVRRKRWRSAAAWTAEKLGRLKLNGRLRAYSPLSRLSELELLYIGVTGKMRLWNSLEVGLGPRLDEFDFRQLAERASRQRSRVGELHLQAAARCFHERT